MIRKIVGIKIAGISCCIPKKRIINRDVKNHKNILRTIKAIGIESRPVADENISTSDLVLKSAEHIIRKLQWKKEEIDILIFVSQTPDYLTPATSGILQDKLKLKKSILVYDINLGCSGYTHGLIAISSIGLAIFYSNNAYSIFQSLRIYSSKFDEARIFGDVATLNPLMELERFLNIFSYKHGLFTFASLLLFLSIIFLTYLLINRIIPNSERRLVIFILCSFLAIFLMPSKWAWYYMVYLPLPILGLFFFIVYLNKIKVTIWLTLLTLLTLVSVRNQNLEYNLAPIVNVNLNNFFEVYTLIFQVSAFFLFLFLLVFIVRLLGRFSYISTSLRLFQTLNLLIVSSFLILLGYKITPLLLDSQTNNRWSFIKQNILFNSPNSCGLFSEFGVQYKTVMNSLDDYPYAPCFKPLLFNYGVWDYPEIIFQSFNILDQQRLGYEIKIESSTCINDYSNRYEEICVYRTAKNIVNSSVKIDVKYPQY